MSEPDDSIVILRNVDVLYNPGGAEMGLQVGLDKDQVPKGHVTTVGVTLQAINLKVDTDHSLPPGVMVVRPRGKA